MAPIEIAKQPPSGGCVLKHQQRNRRGNRPSAATFGWLCVETQTFKNVATQWKQPPSGGCVLKHWVGEETEIYAGAATFGWLCVETN